MPDLAYTRIIDTVAVLIPATQSNWLTILQAVAAVATLATIPAAIAAWKAASAARDSAEAAAQQAAISAEEWRVRREEEASRQHSIDLQLIQFAEAACKRVDALCAEMTATKQSNNANMGWVRNFYEEVRTLEPTIRDLLISCHGASQNRGILAQAAYRQFGSALGAIESAVRLSKELSDADQPDGSQAAFFGFLMYPEHLQVCVSTLSQLARPL